nr:MAG TPA: hypothetical protein [Caudoviricetes sp.]
MKTIEKETSVIELDRALKLYIRLQADGAITSDELSDILVRIIKRKIQLAEITTLTELLSYINHVYSLYMNDEISDTEYETTTVIIDDMIAKAFR